jgi:hypothetical protein
MIHTIEEAITRLRYIQLDSDFAPEDILHMVLAGGVSQTLLNLRTGDYQPAVEFLCCGTREIPNYPIPGGIVKESETGACFVKGSKKFPVNEYPNQFLGTFAMAGVHLDSTPVMTDKGNRMTLADMADVAMQNRTNPDEEQSWSLILFAAHPGTTKEWTNRRGEIQSVELILSKACRRPYGSDPCFGSHLIQGIAFAVRQFCLEQDVDPTQLKGVWRQAWDFLHGAVQRMERSRLDNGALDVCWFREKSFPRSGTELRARARGLLMRRFHPAKAIVYPTGHLLNAIAPASLFLGSDPQWIYDASYVTAQTIETQWIDLAKEISALTHAIRALKILGVR